MSLVWRLPSWARSGSGTRGAHATTPDTTTLALFLGGAALFIVSALALGVASWGRDDEPGPAAASDPAASVSAWRWPAPWRAAGLALAVALGLLAFLLNDNNTFTVLLLPSIMILRCPEQNPSFTRTSGAIPVAVVPPALGLYALGGGLCRAIPGLTGAGASILAVGAAAATVSILSFGIRFSDHKDPYVSRILNSSEIADVISDFGRENGGLDNTHLRSAPYWVDTRVVALEVGDLAWGVTNVAYELKQAVAHLSKPGPLL